MNEQVLNLKSILSIIFRVSNKSARIFAEGYLLKDVSVISRWKTNKIIPKGDDINKIVEFTEIETTLIQRTLIKDKIKELINKSPLNEDVKQSILGIEDFAKFILETLNIALALNDDANVSNLEVNSNEIKGKEKFSVEAYNYIGYNGKDNQPTKYQESEENNKPDLDRINGITLRQKVMNESDRTVISSLKGLFSFGSNKLHKRGRYLKRRKSLILGVTLCIFTVYIAFGTSIINDKIDVVLSILPKFTTSSKVVLSPAQKTTVECKNENTKNSEKGFLNTDNARPIQSGKQTTDNAVKTPTKSTNKAKNYYHADTSNAKQNNSAVTIKKMQGSTNTSRIDGNENIVVQGKNIAISIER